MLKRIFSLFDTRFGVVSGFFILGLTIGEIYVFPRIPTRTMPNSLLRRMATGESETNGTFLTVMAIIFIIILNSFAISLFAHAGQKMKVKTDGASNTIGLIGLAIVLLSMTFGLTFMCSYLAHYNHSLAAGTPGS